MSASNEFAPVECPDSCCLVETSTEFSITLLSRLLEREIVGLDDRNAQGETALHIASSSGNLSAVKYLLEYGADLFIQDLESGWTALHRCLYHQHIHIAALLIRFCQLRYGRNRVEFFLRIKDHAGESAADIISFAHQRIAVRSSFTSSKHHKQVVSSRTSDLIPTRRGGLVYTCGRADYQLGYHLPRALIQSTPKIVLFPSACRITQISASKFHTVALNADGQCFTWGFGKGGRLGLGTQCDHLEPALVKKLAHVFLVKVAAGENHTLALSQNGQLYSWGSNSFGQLGHSSKCTLESRLFPKRVDALRGFIVREIAASRSHSAAICQSHKVANTSDDNFEYNGNQRELFTWGNNKKGQLGRSEAFAAHHGDSTPKRVNLFLSHAVLSEMLGHLDSMYVDQISIAENHTLVLLNCTRNQVSQGQVWRCGNGYYHLVRVNFEKAKETPRKSTFLAIPPVSIVRISCARNHSMALDSRGQVYVWGSNKTACAQNVDTPAIPSYPGAPCRVKNLCSFGLVVDISASHDRCAIVTGNGDLVTWGYGPEGSLGHGSQNTYQPQPKRVSGVKKAVQVAAGHQHTVILISPHEDDFRSHSTMNTAGPNSLLEITQQAITCYMDFTNVGDVLQYAQSMSLSELEASCSAYIRWNLDIILEMTSRDRLDAFFDALLPLPSTEFIRRNASNPKENCSLAPSTRCNRMKTACQTLLASPKEIPSTDLPSKSTCTTDLPVNTTPSEKSVDSIGHREKKKRAKFVRLEDFHEKERSGSDHHSFDQNLFLRGNWSSLSETRARSLKEIMESEKNAPKRMTRPEKALEKSCVVGNSLACWIADPIKQHIKKSTKSCPWKEFAEDEKRNLLRDIQKEEALQSKRQVEHCARAQDATLNCWGYCTTPSTLPLVEMQLLQANQGPLDVLIETCDGSKTITLHDEAKAKKRSKLKKNRKEKQNICEQKEKKERVRKEKKKTMSNSEYRVKNRNDEKSADSMRQSKKQGGRTA